MNSNNLAKADEENKKSVSEDRGSDINNPCGTYCNAATAQPKEISPGPAGIGSPVIASTGPIIVALNGLNHTAELRISAPGTDYVCKTPRIVDFILSFRLLDPAGVTIIQANQIQTFRVRCLACTTPRVSKYPAGNVIVSIGNAAMTFFAGAQQWSVILTLVAHSGGDSASVVGLAALQNTLPGGIPNISIPVAPIKLERKNTYECCPMILL